MHGVGEFIPQPQLIQSDLLIVNIPNITRTTLLIIHRGGIMVSPLLSNCSPFKTARKANIAKEVTDNKADSH